MPSAESGTYNYPTLSTAATSCNRCSYSKISQISLNTEYSLVTDPILFGRGHFVVNVPYDQHLPWIFQGEEISIGLRGFS